MLRRPDPQIEAVINADHGDPFSFLGMHRDPNGICVRAMLPNAQTVSVLDSTTGNVAAKAVQVHRDGFFVAALTDREEPFRLAVDTIPGMVWTCLPDGQRDFLNQRWLDFTGLTLGDAIGWGWTVAIHPDDVTGMLQALRDTVASGAPGE